MNKCEACGNCKYAVDRKQAYQQTGRATRCGCYICYPASRPACPRIDDPGSSHDKGSYDKAVLFSFIDEFCHYQPDSIVPTSDVYTAYLEYCKEAEAKPANKCQVGYWLPRYMFTQHQGPKRSVSCYRIGRHLIEQGKLATSVKVYKGLPRKCVYWNGKWHPIHKRLVRVVLFDGKYMDNVYKTHNRNGDKRQYVYRNLALV